MSKFQVHGHVYFCIQVKLDGIDGSTIFEDVASLILGLSFTLEQKDIFV